MDRREDGGVSADLLDALRDLGAQLTDARTTLRRIEADLEIVRRLVVSHGERLGHLERGSITPPPRPYGEVDHG